MKNPTGLTPMKHILSGAIILMVVVASVFFVDNLQAHSQTRGQLIYKVDDPKSDVSFGYGINDTGREVAAFIACCHDQSLQSLESYRDFNHDLLEAMANETQSQEKVLPFKITFRQPLSEQAFAQFANSHNFQITGYTIFALQADGRIATIGGGPVDGELIPRDTLNMVLDSVEKYSQESGGAPQFLGWVDITGEMTPKQALKLTYDPRIFAVDAIEAHLQLELTNERLQEAGIPRLLRVRLLSQGFEQVDQIPLASMLYAATHEGVVN